MSQLRYSDIDISFIKNASTHDIFRKTGADCVKLAITNLILTNSGERKFRPDIGSGAYNILFENADAISSFLLEQKIRETIVNYEPRASISELSVNMIPEKNSVEVFLSFFILNINKPETISLTVKRNR